MGLLLLLICLSSSFGQLWAAKPKLKINTTDTMRLVVLGGWVGNGSKSNSVFMEACPARRSQIPDLPKNISHGVGAFLPNPLNSILICGGFFPPAGPSRDCFEFLIKPVTETPSVWTSMTSMISPRANAAISVIGSNKVWITGGRSSRHDVLDSTEIMQKTGGRWTVSRGPELGRKTASHCAVLVPSKGGPNVFIIGGGSFDSRKNKFVVTNTLNLFDITENEIIEAYPYPSMRKPRSGHACTAVSDNEESLGILVAGGKNGGRDVLDSVEFLDFTGEEVRWKELTPLPRRLSGAKMIMKPETVEGNGATAVLIGGTGFGGSGSTELEDLIFSNDVLAYSNKDNSWSKIGEVVETVAYHVVVAVESKVCHGMEAGGNDSTRDNNTDADIDSELFDLRINIY